MTSPGMKDSKGVSRGARQFSELCYSIIYSVDFLSAFFSEFRDESDLSYTPSVDFGIFFGVQG